jgi:AAA domain
MPNITKPIDLTPLFPRDLLNKSVCERVEFFRAKVIGHPYINEVRDRVLWAIEDSAPGSLVICCGPSGVGKTTVMREIVVELTKRRLVELEQDPGLLAVASLHLMAPQTGNFDWKKHYFKPLLVSMEEPLVNKKIDMSLWSHHHEANMRLIANRRTDGELYREAVETALHHRQPTAILIDDAQHVGVISSSRKQLDQTNTFKSVADRTKITHVLFATYEFVPFRNLNGQVSRRSLDIHFPRYLATDKTQRTYFINALFTFQRWLPLPIMPEFVKADSTCPDWDFFYERSLGCIGVLKDWLTRAYSLALRSKAETITWEHLEKRALSVLALTKLLAEITAGESEMEETIGQRTLLRGNLGLEGDGRRQSSPARIQASNPKTETAQETNSPKPNRKGGRPGKRNPKRDKTGKSAPLSPAT